MRPLTFISLLLVPGLTSPAGAGEVRGRVAVEGRSEGAVVTTIVYAEPLDGRAPQRPGRFKLEQRNKSFHPRVLAVPAGSIVEFPNQDPIFHNVFSLSRPGPFDLGLYRAGESKSRTFNAPATYRVFCNIHPRMTAVLLVLPTPFIAEADAAGNFRLDLPPGRYRLSAWSERSSASSLEINVANGPLEVAELKLDESKYVELPHKNKYGQDYPASAYDPLRQDAPR